MEMISRFTMTYAGLGLLFTMKVIFFLCCRRCFGRYALIGCYAKTIIV